MQTETLLGARWNCLTDGGLPGMLSQVLNPITKTVIRIEPPVEVTSEAELNAIYNRLSNYCKIAWDSTGSNPAEFRLDPEAIGANWLKRVPPAVADSEAAAAGVPIPA